MLVRTAAAALLLSVSGTAIAQGTAEPLPLPLEVSPVAAEPAAVLPANTEVLLSVNQDVTTKGKKWNEGDTFNLTVVHDVIHQNHMVIPKGSRAVGEIAWLTDKGMFGKSGKMDIELKYVEVGGRRVDIDGTYRQEGEGNTLATVGGVVLVGVFAGFITGKSAVVPQGRELMAHTQHDIPLALPRAQSADARSPLRVGLTPVSLDATREAGAAAARWRDGG